MDFIYSFSVYSYSLLLKLAAPFHPKARLWVNGRKGVLRRMKNEIRTDKPLIWFHFASLGEFEQGRPVMEKLKKLHPEKQLLITFFSPSGYEIRKNYALADYVYYLPVDTPKKAKIFLDICQPELVVFVKYEFWFHYIQQCHKRNIPLIFISAAFRKDQHFFKAWGGWFRRQLRMADHYFVQKQSSLQLLSSIGIRQASLSGDTRFDRVSEICSAAEAVGNIEVFAHGKPLMMAGSCWPQEEEILAEWFAKNQNLYKLVLVPHDISIGRITEIEKTFSAFKCLRFSVFEDTLAARADVLIIDSIGMLNRLYRHARYAVVGGGFGSGLHNILEAATFGIPVFYGPKTKKFPEAAELQKAGGGFEIQNASDLISMTQKMDADETAYNQAASASKQFIESGRGATQKIIDYIEKTGLAEA